MKIKEGKYKTVEGARATVVDIRKGQAIGWVHGNIYGSGAIWDAQTGECLDNEDKDLDLTTSYDILKTNVAQIIEQNKNKSGFKGDWLSSTALSKAIQSDPQWQKLNSIQRGKLIQSLGYIPHPAFYKGRSPVIMNGDRPIIYIKENSLLASLPTSQDAIDTYLQEQGGE